MSLTKFRLRRGTTIDWQAADPVLSQGEPGYDVNLRRLKVGDGITPWTSLAYQTGDADELTEVFEAVDDVSDLVTQAGVLFEQTQDAAASVNRELPGGVAGLDGTGKLILSRIPDSVKTDSGGKPVGKGELVVNLDDYLPVGNVPGTTDNLAAITTALTDAGVGGRVRMTPGKTYAMSGPLTITSAVLDGPFSTIKKIGATTSNFISFAAGSVKAGLRGVIIDANSLVTGSVINHNTGASAGTVVEYCWVINATAAIGARVRDGNTNITFRWNTFDGVNMAFYSDGECSFLTYEKNRIRNWKTRGIYTISDPSNLLKVPNNVTLRDNRITDLLPGGSVRQPIVFEGDSSVATSQATLDTQFPTTGANDTVAYSTDGITEFTGVARTAIGATGWAAATAKELSVKANASALTSAAATVAGTVAYFGIFANVPFTVTNKSLTANVATLDIGAHTIPVGTPITVSGVDATFNGSYVLTAVGATTISYAKTAANVASTASGGTVLKQNQRINWRQLPVPQTVTVGGTLSHAVGDIAIEFSNLIRTVKVIENTVLGPGKAWTALDPGTADQISLHDCADFEVTGNISKYGGDGGFAIGGYSRRGVVSGNVGSFNDVTGVFLGSSTSPLNAVTVTGNTFMNNGQNRNGDRNSQSRSGIRGYQASGIVLGNNTLGDDQAVKTQNWGISLTSSSNISIGTNVDAGNILGLSNLDGSANTSIRGLNLPQTATSTATFTLDSNVYSRAKITAQAVALNIANPTGTPTAMQSFILRVKDNGTARAITYGSQFRALGVTMPTSTVANKTLYLGFIWNAEDSKWDCIAAQQEA